MEEVRQEEEEEEEENEGEEGEIAGKAHRRKT